MLAKSPSVTLYTEGFSHFVTSITAPVASGWSTLAGWDSHPLESAAFARRTPLAVVRQGKFEAEKLKLGPAARLPQTGMRSSDLPVPLAAAAHWYYNSCSCNTKELLYVDDAYQ